MRTPQRKAGKYTGHKLDARLTQAKYDELAEELDRLKRAVRPRLIAEVKRLAADGDFSENAAYSIAKGRLRGLNRRLDEIEDLLRRAQIIEPPLKTGRAVIGSRVRAEVSGRTREWLILGPSETDPDAGVISADSPIGAALLGATAGAIITAQVRGRKVEIRVLEIS